MAVQAQRFPGSSRIPNENHEDDADEEPDDDDEQSFMLMMMMMRARVAVFLPRENANSNQEFIGNVFLSRKA